jgi:serine protease Do
MRIIGLSRAKPAGWLLAAMLATPATLAQSRLSIDANPLPDFGSGTFTTRFPVSNSLPRVVEKGSGSSAQPFPPPLVPKPAPANRRDLPAAFNKPTPASLADLRSIEQHVKALVARVSPVVVAVEIGDVSGSGVVISADGLVLTAGHVCGRPKRDVVFTFPDGQTARGKTLGAAADDDTGLMRITDPGNWPHAAMGDLQQTRVGDWALALGHPGGFDLKRSLVVRLGRVILLAPGIVQSDCPISPGDSGGPLFDMHGRVIGVHSAISSSPAENFHVPVTEFYDNWTELVASLRGTGQGTRPLPYIGASFIDETAGCEVSALDENSPAARAGLKVGDVVLKVGGHEVNTSAFLWRWVTESDPGDTINLDIKRGDKRLSFEVKLQAQPHSN